MVGKKKIKYYGYVNNGDQYKPISKKDFASGVLPDVISRISPSQKKLNKDLYEEGFIGLAAKTGGDYANTMEWGSMGGRPPIHTSKAIRQAFYRVNKKLKENKPLNEKEQELAKQYGIITEENQDKAKRPGAYKTNLKRAMTPKERKAR
jgi:hypothetical protein